MRFDGALPVRCQNCLWRDRRVIGLVDHAVVRLDGGPVALAGRADGAPGHAGLELGACNESIIVSFVTEVCAAKLLRCPFKRIECVAYLQWLQAGRFGHPHEIAPVGFDFIDINGFDRFFPFVVAILASTPLCLANGLPVGSLVTSAKKVLGIDKALDHPGSKVVLRFKVCADPAQHQPQDVGGEVVAVNAVAQQKAAHAQHAVQMLALLVFVPADPLFSVTQL